MNGPRRPLLLALIAALPATAGALRERLVVSTELGAACSLRLEADDEAGALRLRLSPEGPRCRASREDVQRLLAAAFAKGDLQGPPPSSPLHAQRGEGPGEGLSAGAYRSLFLGRLVDYPWLAAALVGAASADRGWDRRRGRPVAAETHAFVAALLSRREVTAQLEAPIAPAGYRIASATVEKVLVAELRDVREYEGPRPAGKLPFDAMVWFRLERAPGSAR